MSRNTYSLSKKFLNSDNPGLRNKPQRLTHYFWNTLYKYIFTINAVKIVIQFQFQFLNKLGYNYRL